MNDLNPYRRLARGFAFGFFFLAGVVLFVSVFFVMAAAIGDFSTIPELAHANHTRMVVTAVSMFGTVILMIALCGWRIQRLFGQRRLPDKLAARSAVNVLRLGSLGCALWLIPSTLSALMIGTTIMNGTTMGVSEIVAGVSGSAIAIIVMMSIAQFLSRNLVTLNSHERQSAYARYISTLESSVAKMADPATRESIQDQTLHLLPKLDVTLKSALLEALAKLKLLTGNTRVELNRGDFQSVDLTVSSLPHADLREINLAESKLRGATLFKVNLSRANLKKSDLSRARLQHANLRQADLTDAILKEAKLRGADMAETVLQRADLSDANLNGANLQGANLRGANLSGAMLKGTDFRGADLTSTIVTPDQLKLAIR